MEIFGGVILGPCRINYFVQDVRRLSSQIYGLVTNLINELDREIARGPHLEDAKTAQVFAEKRRP